MVEPNTIGDHLRLSLSIQRASFFIPLSSDSVFAFGSCKEGWYYRCLGVDPMLLYNKQKKREMVKGNRILISVTFLGSAGPIRFVANEGDLVASVIDTALKCYAREGRLPILGSDFNDFLFYCPMVGPGALSPWEAIGSFGARNFMLCKKPEEKKVEEDNGRSNLPINGASKGAGGSFKAWINKSFSLKVTTQ